MIECPFCNESFEEDELIYEFNWGEVMSFFYNRSRIREEPKAAFKDRSFYVCLKYDWHGNAMLSTCTSSVNPQKHPGLDPLCTKENGWPQLVQLLAQKKTFEVHCSDKDKSLPTIAKILPIVKKQRRNRSMETEGVSTGTFCPYCEQHLKPEVLRAKSEVRILLSGRPGSGKTVYVTQLISELMQGRQAHSFTIEAANQSVLDHYLANKNRLKAFGNGFVLATNPGVVQDPYVFLMSNGKSNIRLVIQDVAGEDTENRTKYNKAVRNADMLLFFIDPWHIEEVRSYHKKHEDLSNAIVDRSTKGRYSDLSGIFQQMMSAVNRDFTAETKQLAGVLLVKGDYLNPPMLSRGSQPECEMMQQAVPFNDPNAMEFSFGMRSSFVRQCMLEWESTRTFARDVESKYSARNIRYFVASALGQSTHLRQTEPAENAEEDAPDADPDKQFGVGGGKRAASSGSEGWNYDEQVLESAARPEHVIDPILWCLSRKGIEF